MKSPEFYKERIQKREDLKSELPIDKQLEGSLGKTKWKFENPLYTLRNSESPSDQYFIEKLKQYNKDNSLDSSLNSSFDIIEKAKEKEEKELLFNLKITVLLSKGLNDNNQYVRLGTAQSLGALAPINPKLASRLYEKGLSDNNPYVRQGPADSLSTLSSVNPELYVCLYEKGLSDDDPTVRRAIAQSLGALATVNPELASRLYEKGLNDNNQYVREGTAASLGALATVNPELAGLLYKKGLNDNSSHVRMETTQSLGALAMVNPELASRLYKKGLNGNSDVRRGTAASLGALAPVNPELAARLYEKGLNDNNSDVRLGIAKSLDALVAVNPELASRLYEKGLSDNDPYVRLGTAKSLDALAAVNPELASRLYEKGSNDNDHNVRWGIAESLGALATVNPELASRLYEKGSNDNDHNVRWGIAESLGALATVNPELYAKLYEKGLNDNDPSVRRGTARSLDALAAVNPELASRLYEKGLSDNDDCVRQGTAQSLGVLVVVNPELYVRLYEKGLSDNNDNVRQGTAASLKDYHFKNNPLTEKVNKIINDRTDESSYIFVFNLLSDAINEKQPAQVWEYLEIFNKVKCHLEEKNKDLDAIKQVASVEKFFNDQQLELANLAKLFSPKEFGVFLTALSSDTLLYTKSFLEISKPVYSDAKAAASLKSYFNQNSLRQDEIEKIFETSAQFIKSNKTEQFISIVDKGEKVQETLDKILLDVVAQEVGIDSSTLPSESLKRWNTPYLAYLGSNNKIIEERIKGGEANYKNVQALYKKIVEHGFIGDFKKFILDLKSGDEIGEDIASHNKNVLAKFKDLGIDPRIWYDYSENRDFLVSKEVKVDNTNHFKNILAERAKTVSDLLTQIKPELSPRQYEPLMHILEGAKNKGLKDITDYDELKKQYQLLNDRIIKIKEESFKDSKEEYFGSLFEHLGHLDEAVELFKKENITGTETKEQGFRVKLWDRDPERDLFQGNYTHCCIAVGVKDAPQEGGLHTHDPATVAQFLVDAGIQVAEVYDQERKDPIANTWLFVSKDSNGEPVLVLDNVEVNNKYKEVVVNSAIRDNLFVFAKDFAIKCNIPKVGIGMVGTNDIEWQSLDKMIVAPVDKVGGYLKDYSSAGGTRAGRYYLEAYNAQTLGEIYNEEKDKSSVIEKQEKISSGLITVIDMATGISSSFSNTEEGIQSFANRNNLSYESIMADLDKIETESFANTELRESPEEILENIQSDKGISFVFMENNKIVGYLSSLSADKFTPITNHREYDTSDKTLYIESIAGKVDPYQTLNKLREQAKERGYEKISLHGISPRINKALIRYGFEKKATVDNWAGDKAEYMEMILD